MKIRILKMSHTDNTNKIWYTYRPQYKKWYNIFWYTWYDSLYGYPIEYKTYKEAEEMAKEQLRRTTHKSEICQVLSIK